MGLFCPKETGGREKPSRLLRGDELLWKRAAGRADTAGGTSTLGVPFAY